MAAKRSSVRVNLTGLTVMASALKKMADSKYHIQIGIFGAKNARRKTKGSGLTNAEVGFVHEMGSVSRQIPRRSFLMDTFQHHGDELMTALKPDVKQLFLKGKVDQYLKVCVTKGIQLVQKAFFTSGWGSWAPLKRESLLRKLKGSLKKRRETIADIFAGRASDKPLIDTGQLWQSVDGRVVNS